MDQAAATGEPAVSARLAGDVEVQASTELYHLLLHTCTQTALDRVVNAGPSEGLRAWQLLVERFDPRLRSRAAGQLLALLQFDFGGDALAKMESFERAVLMYEANSGETVPESLRIGMVMNRVQDTELARGHLRRECRQPGGGAFGRGKAKAVDAAIPRDGQLGGDGGRGRSRAQRYCEWAS